MPNCAKPAASESLKETRDKDSSLAAALKTAIFNQMLSKKRFLYIIVPSFTKPAASDSLKETRDKDSSLAAALKTVTAGSESAKYIIIDPRYRPEIRRPVNIEDLLRVPSQ